MRRAGAAARVAVFAAMGLAVTVTVTVTAEADAAGFAIREQSAAFQGLSFAGVAAGGADISTMYFNPATLALHDGHQASFSLSYIAPKAEFELEEATNGAGTPIRGSAGGDIAENAFLPAIYGMAAFGDWRFGLGLTAPFGLVTDQPDDWVGRYHATDSELATINVNPAVTYRVSDRLAIGAGLVLQYADATLARAIDFGSLNPAGTPTANDGSVEIEGDDIDFGFTLGLLAEPRDGTRIGLGYRSQINHSLSGDADFDTGGPIGEALAGPLFTDTGGRASLSTPQIASLGVRQRVHADVDILATVEWTGWSTFDELVVQFDNPAQPASTTREDWNDSWFVALGAEWRPVEELTLQVGTAFDQSPIEDSLRTPRIPGNDRYWFSLGTTWSPRPWVDVTAAYSHIRVEDGDVDLVDTPTPLGGRGTLRGTFDNRVDILTVGGVIRF